jgi:LPXTG-motif cell wall-anchored protein
VSGNGFQSGSTVTVELHSDPIILGTTTVATDGSFTFIGVLPDGVVGNHEIVAMGTANNGTTISASTPITINQRDTQQVLALTGTNSYSLLATALALIALGLVLSRKHKIERNPTP